MIVIQTVRWRLLNGCDKMLEIAHATTNIHSAVANTQIWEVIFDS